MSAHGHWLKSFVAYAESEPFGPIDFGPVQSGPDVDADGSPDSFEAWEESAAGLGGGLTANLDPDLEFGPNPSAALAEALAAASADGGPGLDAGDAGAPVAPVAPVAPWGFDDDGLG